MKLSEVLERYLLTSWSEGIFAVSWHQPEEDTFYLEFHDEHGSEYSGVFQDQDVTLTTENRFVVSCDGEPWEFAAWTEAWTKK